MSDTEEERIQFIFQTLHNSSSDRLTKVMDILSADVDPIVRHEAAYILGELGGDEATKGLISAIHTDANKFVVHEAMLALGTTGDYSQREMVRSFIDNEDEDLRRTASITLQRFDNIEFDVAIPTNVEFLEPDDLTDFNEEIRIQIAFELLNIGSEEAIQTLLMLLNYEDDPIVKHEIIFCLGEISSNLAIDPLLEELRQSQNIFVVHEALMSLGTLGNPISRPTIEEFVEDPRPEISISAKIALERLR